jgi:hypothetical protein
MERWLMVRLKCGGVDSWWWERTPIGRLAFPVGNGETGGNEKMGAARESRRAPRLMGVGDIQLHKAGLALILGVSHMENQAQAKNGRQEPNTSAF